MASKNFFSVDSKQPKPTEKGGSIVYFTSDEVPGFVNISFAVLKLNKGGFQEPIWHPNANKLGYCLQGDVLVSIHGPGKNDVFTVKQGDMFFIPKGYAHHIENINDKETVLNFAMNNVKPEVMSLSKSVFSLTDTVFSSTFNTPSKFIDGLTKDKTQEMIKILPVPNSPSETNSSAFKYNIGESAQLIKTKGGYLQSGIKDKFPVLDGLGILRFGLSPKGIVEPHWHTNAGELVYIVKGRTRITVLAPDGTLDVLEVSGGQGAFAAASHFHNIENIGTDDVEVIAYFSHAEPDYIGVGEVVGSYSNEVLASVFNVAPHYFDTFKKPNRPLVIVPV